MGRVQKSDKSGKAVKKTSWQKLKGHTSEGNNDKAKRKLFHLLGIALQGGAKVGNHVFVGTNSVMKSIKNGKVAVVCLSRDSPKNLFNCVVEACVLTATPVIALPSASSVEMANTFALKRASIFALRRHDLHHINERKEENDGKGAIENEISNDERIDGMVDGVIDAALKMYTPNLLFKHNSQREDIM